MRPRHAISDADWDRIKHLLPGQPGQHGKVAKDNRLFIDAVLWIAKTGRPVARPARAVRQLEQRLAAVRPVGPKGVWRRVFEALQDPDLEWLILDSTVVRAHPHAAGAKKSGRQRGPGRAGPGPQPGRVRDQDPRRRQRARAARRARS